MAVNTMSVEDAYALINALHAQVTGQNSIQATDLSSFVSVAQETLSAGYDAVLGAISQVLTKTMIAVRPYSRKFAGLEFTSDKWGAITRKINFIEGSTETDPTWTLTDGQSVDQYVIDKPKVLETHYYGSETYMDKYTVLTTQLDVAFSNPTEFAAFMSGVATHFSNMWEQWLENVSRQSLLNFMAGKINAGNVVYLLDEYNTATGQSLTPVSVKLPANYAAFMKWAYARVADLSRAMTERSEAYQTKITGKPIVRHTPVEDQRLFMLSSFLNSMKAEVQSGAYNDSFLNYAYTEDVTYWQAFNDPDKISITPVQLKADATLETGTAVAKSNIIGVLFDRDAIGYNIYQNEIVASPYNARGQYYNNFHHARVQTENDFTEKGIVLALTAA
jgi:hypothetical protein